MVIKISTLNNDARIISIIKIVELVKPSIKSTIYFLSYRYIRFFCKHINNME